MTLAHTHTADAWETAYLRFETPSEEIRKFGDRLLRLGVRRWSGSSRVAELFCGRGNGLHALTNLGFTKVSGVDISTRLLGAYRGPASVVAADCRAIPLRACSQDIVIVQGGFHHLDPLVPALDQTLMEVRRILRAGGRLVVVEPWLTPFLRGAHVVAKSRIARRIWRRLDAFACMVENEQATYEAWLSSPELVLDLLARHFRCERRTVAWGKLLWVGNMRH